MAMESSAEQPIPVRTVANAIGQWIGRLGRVWIDGQLTEISRRPGMNTVFFVLRDPAADISLRVTAARQLVDTLQLREGTRVVVWAKPEYYLAKGTFELKAFDIRPVGVGELLARIERLKQLLASEGLFAPERKRQIPFLPGTVGLICGRASAAERDVVENAKRRWPAVIFRIEATAVQGPYAVPEIVSALQKLDADATVDVIVIARGGGSVEDLLPFSDEALLRAVSRCRTPVVSAIGHEPDSPLLDLVADVRASTPTDAGKRIVPDVAQEHQLIAQLRARALRSATNMLDRQQHNLDSVRARPALATPHHDLERRSEQIKELAARSARSITNTLERATDEIIHVLARVRSLSPATTLERGYAVIQDDEGRVVNSISSTASGRGLRIRVTDGSIAAEVKGVTASRA